jgi:RNA polymerase sigma-70 factor (ECF subfamily)
MLRSLVCGDAVLADDLAQETFLRAWLGLSKFREKSKFSTWLYSIAWNVFLSDARCTRHRTADSLHSEYEERHVETTSAFERINERIAIESALKFLSAAERAAIALTYGQDLTHEEAAAVLNCPIGTLKTNVLRSKAKLKQHLTHLEPIQ